MPFYDDLVFLFFLFFLFSLAKRILNLLSAEIRRTDSEISSEVDATPGKLDHASIVAYEVGSFSLTDNRKFAPNTP